MIEKNFKNYKLGTVKWKYAQWPTFIKIDIFGIDGINIMPNHMDTPLYKKYICLYNHFRP